MIELYTSLISQFKNFWQYICLGTTLWVFNYYQFDHSYLIGGIFISLGVAKAVEELTNFIKVYYNEWRKKKSQQTHIEEQKAYYISEYKNLSKKEKEIIDCCLKGKILVYGNDEWDEEYEYAIYSLAKRQMGRSNIGGSEFVMNKLCFDTLLEYKSKKN